MVMHCGHVRAEFLFKSGVFYGGSHGGRPSEPCSNHDGLQGLESSRMNEFSRSMTDQPFRLCPYFEIAKIVEWVCLDIGQFLSPLPQGQYSKNLDHDNLKPLECGCALYSDNPEKYCLVPMWTLYDLVLEGARHCCSPGLFEECFKRSLRMNCCSDRRLFTVGAKCKVYSAGSSCVLNATVPNLCLSFCQSPACWETQLKVASCRWKRMDHVWDRWGGKRKYKRCFFSEEQWTQLVAWIIQPSQGLQRQRVKEGFVEIVPCPWVFIISETPQAPRKVDTVQNQLLQVLHGYREGDITQNPSPDIKTLSASHPQVLQIIIHLVVWNMCCFNPGYFSSKLRGNSEKPV